MADRKLIARLFWPVLIEQSVAVIITLLSTIMVRGVSEAAMAGVGMLGSFNMLVMNTFTAVATGVAVIVSQRVGAGDRKTAGEAAAQSLTLVVYIASFVGLLLILFSKNVLGFLFGSAEEDVLAASRTYLLFSAASMPLQAIASTISGIMRSTGNTRLPMLGSVMANVAYIITAWTCINPLNMGVAGAGTGLAVSRLVPAAFLGFMLIRRHAGLVLPKLSLRLSLKKLSAVLRVALPSGADALMFEGGKLLTQVFLSGMGTAAVAANAVVSTLSGFVNLPGSTMQIISVTLVGQAFGAKDYKEARKRSWLAVGLGSGMQGVMAMIFLPLAGILIGFFDPSDETAKIALQVLTLSMIATPFAWSASFVLPFALRAAGDAKYTMFVSVSSMIVVRVFGSWLLGVYFGWGLIGIWTSMVIDWVVRGTFFAPRVAGMPKRALRAAQSSAA